MIVSVSKCDQTQVSSTMEGQNQLGMKPSEPEKYFKELEVAVRAVQMACLLCQRVQDSLVSKNNGQVQSKDDKSPVTIAGNLLAIFCFGGFPKLGYCSMVEFDFGWKFEIFVESVESFGFWV